MGEQVNCQTDPEIAFLRFKMDRYDARLLSDSLTALLRYLDESPRYDAVEFIGYCDCVKDSGWSRAHKRHMMVCWKLKQAAWYQLSERTLAVHGTTAQPSEHVVTSVRPTCRPCAVLLRTLSKSSMICQTRSHQRGAIRLSRCPRFVATLESEHRVNASRDSRKSFFQASRDCLLGKIRDLAQLHQEKVCFKVCPAR